ncbi:MAG: Lumazine-binding protein [Crocosphaera sp.]
MFTGFIKDTAIIDHIQSLDSGIELTIKVPHQFGQEVIVKSHISLNGQVFTVFDKQESNDAVLLSFYLSNSRKLGSYERQEKINIEKAISLGEELPGTWFYGVPSGQAQILSLKKLEGEKLEMELNWQDPLIKYLDVKDQVSIDGVLLQIRKMTASSLFFELYPETLKLTNLGNKQEGSLINIEVDPIVKKVGQIMERLKINQ